MAFTKRIICLADSTKNAGSCIAGREVFADGSYGGWIRPVSARPTSEVWIQESMYRNNTFPKLMDIIDVPLAKPAPHGHQTENFEIDSAQPWVKAGELPWMQLALLCEYPTSLWINSQHTLNGLLDCISQEEASTCTGSLKLLRCKDFWIEITPDHRYEKNKTSYRGIFQHNGLTYNLSLTDPIATHKFAHEGQGKYSIGPAYLCISLTEPYAKDSRCHKLVASVLTNPPL